MRAAPQAGSQHFAKHFPRALPKAARIKIEAAVEAHLEAIEALTTVLDEAEPDADLEPYLAGTHENDREDECEDEGAACEDEGADNGDREPSLGATNPDPDRSQLGWANHGSEDHYIESAAAVMP